MVVCNFTSLGDIVQFQDAQLLYRVVQELWCKYKFEWNALIVLFFETEIILWKHVLGAVMAVIAEPVTLAVAAWAMGEWWPALHVAHIYVWSHALEGKPHAAMVQLKHVMITLEEWHWSAEAAKEASCTIKQDR